MKKNTILTALLAGFLTVGLTGCGGDDSSSNSPVNNSTTSESAKTESSSKIDDPAASVIKELSAVNENATIKIGEQAGTAGYYNLVGFKSLTAKQKKVTITSSDETIVKIASTGKQLTALQLGTVEITVTSDVDASKSCKFNLTVEDCFFDRTLTAVSSTWDITNEMAEENPSIKIDSNLADGIYIRNSDGLKWYVETDITIHSVNAGEDWPKFGIVANTTTNTTETNNNKFYFFLDAFMNSESNWTNFGVCEVSNGANWAWNAGIGNNEARHNDAVYVSPTSIGYDTSFKMGMLRDGFDCHLYVNGTYVKSATVLKTIFGNYDEATGDYTAAANTMAGFFAFNSVVTFSNYKFSSDATEVDNMLNAIAEKSYCDWAED